MELKKLTPITKLNIFGILIIIALNVVDMIDIGTFRVLYFLPFIMSILIMLIFNNKQKEINSYIIFLFGILQTISGGMGNTGGAMFIIYSIMIWDNVYHTIFRLSITAIALSFKIILIPTTPIQIVKLFFLYMMAIAAYYVIYTKKKAKKINDDEMLLIIDYIRSGKTRTEIADITCVSPAAISKRLNRMRKKLGFKTVDQMLIMWSEYGQIK